MIKSSLLTLVLLSLIYNAWGASNSPAVIYWDSAEGKTIRTRISGASDYWQLAPTFTAQITQSYCAVASAVSVLNAMPIQKPVDPTYAPYRYFTQNNFFTPEVTNVINSKTVLAIGMTREEMFKTLTLHGVRATSISGDSFNDDKLRAFLKIALGADGKFVLANYLRATLNQVGGGHWSILAAYDAQTDRVLILDVAKYKYKPEWVKMSALRKALDTIDTTSNQFRGLVTVEQ